MMTVCKNNTIRYEVTSFAVMPKGRICITRRRPAAPVHGYVYDTTPMNDVEHHNTIQKASPTNSVKSIDIYEAPDINVDTTEYNKNKVASENESPYVFWSFQILSFLLQNGFSIFFAITIVMSIIMQRNAMNRQTSFFNKTPKAVAPEDVTTTFADVAGCENAKIELREVVDFLKNPAKYTRMGAKIPKGCLLTGGPGLGKTLLARAVAGEADVPFYACSASEFIELFVGVGSSRVRDLFKHAKEHAPCIIFIDEIDAIGKSRGSNSNIGSNDEREQTINQLLTEMDGFTDNKGIVVMAATNRPDTLDAALIRPGRFDRQITLDPPSKADRHAILQIHCKAKPLSQDVNLNDIAGMTVGFSGAELANICNEAAILAARRHNDDENITSRDFYDAIDRVMLGPERKGRIDFVAKKRILACHEAGHAVVAMLLDPESVDKVAKISIIPRGRTGGVTVFEPLEEVIDSGLMTRQYLENKMVVALGGRAAEELVYGENKITTGASNDMEVVQQLARSMVANYGFGSSGIGNVGWGSLMNTNGLERPNMSMYMMTRIDREVVSLAQTAYAKAKQLLLDNEELFNRVSMELYNKEVLNQDDIKSITHSVRKNVM